MASAPSSSLHKFVGGAILLAIIFQQGHARQDYYYPRQQLQQMILDSYGSSQELNNDYSKIAPNDPNFLSSWPFLRELLPPNYEASTNRILDMIEEKNGNPVGGGEMMPEMLPTPQPLYRVPPMQQRNSIKDQTQKKNSNSSKKEYMHACHFKICNMGRKRNARFNNY